MIDCEEIFEDRAFRKQFRNISRRNPINRALFETWGANAEKLTSSEVKRLSDRKTELVDRFIQLLEDTEFANSISYGTGDPRKVQTRFLRIEEIIHEILL